MNSKGTFTIRFESSFRFQNCILYLKKKVGCTRLAARPELDWFSNFWRC